MKMLRIMPQKWSESVAIAQWIMERARTMRNESDVYEGY